MPGHIFSVTLLVLSALFSGILVNPTKAPVVTPISVYGAWHCGNHYCDWSLVRTMTEFDSANHWLIDRGDANALDTVLPGLCNGTPVSLLNP